MSKSKPDEIVKIRDVATGLFSNGTTYHSYEKIIWSEKRGRVFTAAHHARSHISMNHRAYKDFNVELVYFKFIEDRSEPA